MSTVNVVINVCTFKAMLRLSSFFLSRSILFSWLLLNRVREIGSGGRRGRRKKRVKEDERQGAKNLAVGKLT
jgi:hypothetical protein